MNGVSLSTMIGGGWGGGAIPNATGVSEMAVRHVRRWTRRLATGGVRINFIAARRRQPVQRARSSAASPTTRMQGRTTPSSVQSASGADRAGGIVKNCDFNPGFGGPIVKRDKFWFFLSGRAQGADHVRAGHVLQQERRTTRTPGRTCPIRSRPGDVDTARVDRIYQARLSPGRSTPKNKFGISLRHAEQLLLSDIGVARRRRPRRKRATISVSRCSARQVDWNSPVSSKLLLEAAPSTASSAGARMRSRPRSRPA